MKNYIAIAVVAALFIGCGDKEETKMVAKPEAADISKITITQGETPKDEITIRHQKELDGDKKGFYYAYDEKKEETSEEEPHTRMDAERNVKNKVIDGQVVVKEKEQSIDNPYQYVKIDLLKRALSHDFMVKCSACHDDYANGIIGPSLLTKDGNYIYGQLIKYRNDPTKNVLMRDLVNNMTEDELKAIADEIALFNKEIRALKGTK